jgi:predicted nucleotidyltransferase
MAARRTVAAVQTERVLRLVTEVLGQDALGAYEHGSAVLGGVQPTSDIDILVITGRLATLVEKRQLVEGLMAISAPFPPPGLERCVELTVVAQAQVRPWRYPPSFDLQYGEWLRKRFELGDSLPLQAAVNADLTILLTMDEFEGDTCNILLRLARIWQTVVTGSIDRKDRAAEWAQKRLPPDYQQLMERARAMYLGWRPDEWTGLASQAHASADYMISQIRREAARRRPGQVLRLASG